CFLQKYVHGQTNFYPNLVRPRYKCFFLMNPPDEQLKYCIALTLVPGIGSVLAKNLVSYCGSVENIFKRKKSQLEKIPGIGAERADAIFNHKTFERAEEEVSFIRKHRIRSFFYLDEDYPARLKNCD